MPLQLLLPLVDIVLLLLLLLLLQKLLLLKLATQNRGPFLPLDDLFAEASSARIT